MARIDSLSIDLQTTGKDKLAEAYGKVIENLQEVTLADKLKNKDLSGDPTTGTVEAKRFTNVVGKPYGTARTATKADNVKALPVVIAINDDVEYIEEVEEKDLRTYGVDGLIQRRTKNHQDAEAVDEDTKFFAEAVTQGTALTIPDTITDPADEIEKAIQTLQTVKNDFVNGVPRTYINVVMSPEWYGKLRNKINAIPNSNDLGQVRNYEGGIFNNTKIFSSVFLPAGTDYIVMVDGAVAQPVMTSISNPEKIQLSDSTAFGLFTYKGTKTVTPDLIFYKGTGISA